MKLTGAREAGLMVVIILVLLFITSCKHDLPMLPSVSTGTDNNNTNNGNNNNGNNGTSCDPGTVYFNSQVLPLLVSNCAKSGCHDAASHEEGIILDSYINVMNTADVEPFRPSAGDLMEVLTTNDPDDRMPPAPNSPLTSQQINLIQTWIQQGAQNLSCTNTTCDSTTVSYTADVTPLVNNKCKGCHSGANPGGGIVLNSYATVAAQVANGKLLGTIQHLTGYSPMPKNSAMLSICEIGVIRNWIAEGTQNN
ncbi:MAG: c-type cytochrome domain-containing protein [Bacteroidota bacterium]